MSAAFPRGNGRCWTSRVCSCPQFCVPRKGESIVMVLRDVKTRTKKKIVMLRIDTSFGPSSLMSSVSPYPRRSHPRQRSEATA